MKEFAAVEWHRARTTLASAQKLAETDANSAASRAYYAAFHAVTALFALRGRSFSKHSAVRAAVHRELVRGGTWPPELGKAYDALMELRATGDYGGLQQVAPDGAMDAVAMARHVLEAVRQACPELDQLDR